MQKIFMTLLVSLFTFSSITTQADTFGSYSGDSHGQYPQSGPNQRPYKVHYQSNIDAFGDFLSVSFPSDFDPDKSYPVWLKFSALCGSGSQLTGPTHALNYCDSNDVIVVGCNVRNYPYSPECNHFLGDNENLESNFRAAIQADVIEILNQLFHMYNINYVAASGASMGGYSSLRVMTLLPSEYVGAVVASASALWHRPWVQTGSDAILTAVQNGHFNGKFVTLMHGTLDTTVPVDVSRSLTAAAPDSTWWQLVEDPQGTHNNGDYFTIFDYVNQGFPHDEEYGQSWLIPDLWDQIHAWEAAHPEIMNRSLAPLPGWSPPSNWYFPQNIYDDRADKSGNPPQNSAPLAAAGPDQVVTDNDENGFETISLNGSNSSDSDGSIVSYSWSEGGSPIASGATPSVSLNVGTHTITLTVTDDDSATDTDTVLVTVLDGSTPPPVEGTVTSLFQKGVSPDASFAGNLDSTMRSLTGSSFGLHALGKDASIDLRNADVEGAGLIWFDLSSIPANATVASATLKLWHDANEFDSSGNLLVYRIHDPDTTGMWVENNDVSSYTTEAEGCSRYKRPGVAWSGSGGRITDVINETDKVVVPHAALADEWLSADVTADITTFVADTSNNLGWMIRTQSDNTLRGSTYMSDHTDAAKRPTLEVVYSTDTNIPPPGNVAPTAIAGTDQTVTDSDENGSETVTLNGSSSSDSDGTIVSYDWSEGGSSIGSGVNPTVSLAVGSHTITLTVTDDDGATDTDTLLVTVLNGGTPPPPTGNQPSLSELLAACQYLQPGDIPEDNFQPPANALYVATDGNDANAGTSISAPFEHIGKAIAVANANPSTPYTIYIRGGIYYYKTLDETQSITRGNIYITAYNNESVTIRPYYWPGNADAWWNLRCFIGYGSYDNVTFDNLTIEGWQMAFDFSSSPSTPPIRHVTIKNIVARNFTHRGGDPGQWRIFFGTGELGDNVYPDRINDIATAQAAHYQLEDVILSNIEVFDTDITINVGDEFDANIKGLRITNFKLDNPPQPCTGTSAADGFAVVNSYKVMIDHCVVKNTCDDGIDCKAFDMAVINCHVEGTGKNAVKFWKNGELINSMVYNCTPINDGAIIVSKGPARIINSALISKYNGFSSTHGYNVDPGQVGSLEIVNSIFADLDGSVYMVHNNLSSKHSLFFDMRSGLFTIEGGGVIGDVAALNARGDSFGNIPGTPMLADLPGGNFSPTAGSPLINAGTASGVLLPSFDYYGNARSMDGAPDIGPVEFSGTNTPPQNVAPSSVAGSDQNLTDSDNSGSEPVSLDGSASSDSDGTIVSYSWTEGGSSLASGVTPSVNLNIGTHTIVLTVTDDDGAQDSDTVVVTVNAGTAPPSNVAPTAVAGGDQSVTDSDDNGSEIVTLNGLASSDSDGTITSYAWSEGGSSLANGATPSVSLNVGTHTIVLTVTDDDGATDTDTVVVTVLDGGTPPPTGGTVTSLFQKGVSPDAGFAGNLDSTMRSLTGSSFGLHARGKDPSMDLRNVDFEGAACMWFDVSSIPPEATIESASLKIWHEANEFDASGNLVVYRIHDPDGTGMWVENNDASTYTETEKGCSRYKRPGVTWTTAGGRITDVINETDKVTVPHTALASEWLTADVTADISVFAANADDNLGWMIRSQSDDTLRGDTYMSDHSDAAKRPILEVVYSVAGSAPLVITSQPSNQTVTEGQTASFQLVATGVEPITYQWRLNGSPISGEVNSSYTTPATTLADSGNQYDVVVTDANGSLASSLALLTVIPATPGSGFFIQDNGPEAFVSMEAEHYNSKTQVGAHDWVLINDASASGSEAMQASPNTGANNDSGYSTTSPRMDFNIEFSQSGIHQVWIRGLGASGGDDSVHVGLNGNEVTTCDRIGPPVHGTWTWTRDTIDGVAATIDIPSTGIHTLNIWMREDGFIIDKILLTTDASYPPAGNGPPESQLSSPPDADSDGDGATDLEENIAGTNPNDPNDFLFMTGSVANETNLTVTWQGISGRRYDLLMSTNLFSSWIPVPGHSDLPGTGFQLSVSNMTYDSTIYYLLRARMDSSGGTGGPPSNAAPTADAGADQLITLPDSASLNGTITDDGLPGPYSVAWSKIMGPGTVTFGNANAEDTTASFSTDGTYVLRLTADDGELSDTDDVTITVQPEPVVAGSGLLREWWLGISGVTIADLTASPNYPYNPSGSQIVSNLFEGPVDWAENYGTRMRGYFIAPQNGMYSFYIATDDSGELWLSTDENPANASRIAYVDGWTTSREWTKYASQKSSAISLAAGQRYYIEALQKEGTIGDNIAVAVDLPDATFEGPIPATRLNPWISGVVNEAPSSHAGTDQSITLPATVSLDGTTADDGLPGSYSVTWSKVSGPGTVTFGNANTEDTTASFSIDGTYVLRLTADDGALTDSDDVTISVSPESAGTMSRLQISANGRHFETAQGQPFFFMADTSWWLYELTREQVDVYLQTRAAQGFNVLQGPGFMMPDEWGLDINAYGQFAYHNDNISTINDLFFDHIDYIVDKAAEYGIYVALVPIWSQKMSAFSESQFTALGNYLGTRYGNRDNVMWFAGGEASGSVNPNLVRALVNGINAGNGGSQLVTVHTVWNNSSSAVFHNDSWLDFNIIQSVGHSVLYNNYDLITADYNKSPTKPTLDTESAYEDIDDFGLDNGSIIDAAQVRRLAYWSVFAGAAGYGYGANGTFQINFAEDLGQGFNRMIWSDALNLEAGNDMQHLRNLMEARPFYNAVPDQSVLASAVGGGDTRLQAIRASNNSFALVYSTQGNAFSVNMDRLSGTARTYWLDPRTGASSFIGDYGNSGTRTFTPPSSGRGNDWVLVLDDISAGYPAPGN